MYEDREVTIEIAGVKHAITFDKFGTTYVDGMTPDDFLDTLDDDTKELLARRGLEVAKNDPEHFKDIVQRHELTDLEEFIKED